MKKKFYQNEKFQAVFFPIIYFLLTCAIVVTGCVIFYNKYYQPILVDGNSMHPTLVGGGSAEATQEGVPVVYRSNYGIADLHKSAVNNLKRFDVCVTYYPSSWAAEEGASIIKRVWGFPGETLDMSYSPADPEHDQPYPTYTFSVYKEKDGKVLYSYEYKAPVISIERTYEGEYKIGNVRHFTKVTKTFDHAAKFTVENKVFYVNAKSSRVFTKTLANNEYFVMGDNWASSTDSYSRISYEDKLTKNYLQGKAICIYGYATAQNGEAKEIHKFKARYYF